MNAVTVSAPGKLMLSGEWSILENGIACIVLAVDKKVIARIEEAKETSVRLKSHGIETKAEIRVAKVVFENTDPKLVFARNAIETTLKYLQGKGINTKNFKLETESQMHGKSAEKVGFGSSAAAVVAISAAVLKLHNEGIETEKQKEVVFKLGIVAHYLAQGKIGSGFDVAASTFGGALIYKRFDALWLEKELKARGVFEVVEEKWPLFEYRKIDLPKDFELVVGFTGKSASTKELVHKVHEFRDEKNSEYARIIQGIQNVTDRLILALEKKNKTPAILLIEENRLLLKQLGEQSGVELETEEHRIIAGIAKKHGGGGKFSGAGGGDCGIAICFDKKTAKNIKKEFVENGISVIEVKVLREGVRTEKG